MSEEVKKEIERLLQSKIKPIFDIYGHSMDSLINLLKWKPIALVIGNYSSGKSTFINELIGRNVQRTGQSPTDDSFTILTASNTAGDSEVSISGASLVNDESMPFTSLKKFGESLFSHLSLKDLDVQVLKDIAVIDTPGMLDSVTEKSRGYDYLSVIGELARISDLIILMFDPHKAGTINETYQAIRSTLPMFSEEDRVFYVLNRIDECKSVSDLVISYGTLCWNLSQMTGRKDIPRIYLTFAESVEETPQEFQTWSSEREELKKKIITAPKLRISHILEETDRVVRDFNLRLDVLNSFKRGFLLKLKESFKVFSLIAVLLFFLGDIALNKALGYPEVLFVNALKESSLSPENFLIPAAGVFLAFAVFILFIFNFLLPSHSRNSVRNIDRLISLDTTYKQDIWKRIKESVKRDISETPWKVISRNHNRTGKKINRFLEKDMKQLTGK